MSEYITQIGGKHQRAEAVIILTKQPRYKIMLQQRLQRRIDYLLDVHKELKAKGAEGRSHYLTDTDLGKLKQEKLHVKDELYRLQQTLERLRENSANN